MTASVIPLVAGNWKMNGLRSSLEEIFALAAFARAGEALRAEIVICPPATLLMAATAICEGSPVHLGGQDCHSEISGAHTGDISAGMLVDAGASYVILGHSERRADHGESNAMVQAKSLAACRAGLIPIICVGETWAEREAGRALEVVGQQLGGSIANDPECRAFVIAYEPVWAIGTGLIPMQTDIVEMHAFIRRQLGCILAGHGDAVRILYGGSVKPDNAGGLAALENVNGVLVGGGSLKSTDFIQILKAFN
jgi:triosephosphate isomerase